MIPLSYYLCLSFALFGIGLVGVLVRRNAMVVLMCIELMLNAVNLILVASAMVYQSPDAQVVVFFVMIVAAAEVALGLAILTMLYRKYGSLDLNIWSKLKG